MRILVRLLSPFSTAWLPSVAFADALAGPKPVGPIASASGFFAHFAPLLAEVAAKPFLLREMSIVMGGALVYALALGYISHVAMGERGFGPAINGAIAAAGSWAGLGLYAWRFADGAPSGLHGIAAITIYGSLLFLLIAAAAKAFTLGEAVQRRIAASARGREPELPPEGPPEDRIRAAVSRSKR